MNAVKKVYGDLMAFVENFANSTTGDSPDRKEPENAKAWYAEWEDNYLGDFIDNAITRSILRKVADNYYGDQLEGLLRRSTLLTARSYPSLYSVYEDCCQKLGIYEKPKVYVTGEIQGANALSIEVKGQQLILIGRRVGMSLTEKEQSFVIGHELGHHQQGNLVCHTVNGLLDNLNNTSEVFGPLIADTIDVPLKRWCRCSEFNADRAGLICCGDIDCVEGLFNKLGMQEPMTAYVQFQELEESHPHLHTRFSVLSNYKIPQKPIGA